MTLLQIIVIPFLGGLLAWAAAAWNERASRWICITALAADLAFLVGLWLSLPWSLPQPGNGEWLLSFRAPWIPSLGISLHLAMDGLSLLMAVLTVFLGIASVICSWTEIRDRVGFFHFNLMAALTGILGVFLAVDLILFYVFWEIMLVPMYFLIGIWGHENRVYAAIKFFLFTQAGGLLMLVAILGLAYVHSSGTGAWTFNYFDLLGNSMDPATAMLLMLGFFAAFAVKLPAVPLHTWLPDAHTEAPTAGSVILAGLLLKTGAYGLIRFVLPLFPGAAIDFAPIAMGLGEVGILYGAILAFAQTDFKRLVAYTSVSHLGFVLLGVFDRNEHALQGAIMQMISHGISTGALFIIVGALQERIGTRDLTRMGGLQAVMPRMAGMTLIFAMASLGLPGTGNFVGEILVLLGTYEASPLFTIPAVEGLVLAAVYSLAIVQRAFHGEESAPRRQLRDLSLRETALMGVMALSIIWLGIFPQPVINTAAPAVRSVVKSLTVADSAFSGHGNRMVVKEAGVQSLFAVESREVSHDRR